MKVNIKIVDKSVTMELIPENVIEEAVFEYGNFYDADITKSNTLTAVQDNKVATDVDIMIIKFKTTK